MFSLANPCGAAAATQAPADPPARAVRSGRSLRIGTEVRVIVTSVNPIEGLIDLDLVPEGVAAEAREAKEARKPKAAERRSGR